MADLPSDGLPRLRPLPYHDEVVRYLQSEEPEVWRWACSAQARDEHAAAVRGELLKQTYRLDAEGHPELHAACAAAAARLGLHLPVTLYQGPEGAMNASLYFVPGAAHVVLTGPVLERLKGAELEALLGHELAHQLLWEMEGGRYHAADRLLVAALDDPRASPSHLETARLYRLHTELFADRGAAVACGGLEPAVGTLVKMQTGLAVVSPAAYLRQADEICAEGPLRSDGLSHPEVFVRARGLRLWCEGAPDAEAWLAAALQGPLALDRLDLLGQQRLSALTQRVIAQMLRPRCLRSDGMLAHARRFFPGLQPAEGDDAALAPDVASGAGGSHDYLAALLMDFCVADRELDDVPLAAALQLAARIGVDEAFERLALKELGLAKRRFQKLRQDAAALLERAEQQHG